MKRGDWLIPTNGAEWRWRVMIVYDCHPIAEYPIEIMAHTYSPDGDLRMSADWSGRNVPSSSFPRFREVSPGIFQVCGSDDTYRIASANEGAPRGSQLDIFAQEARA